MIVYIAGPLSATTERTTEENVQAAVEVFLALSREGLHAFCPHLTALVPAAFDVPYERWMEHDFAFLERCDVVLMIEGWERSPGARREHDLALTLGKRVIYDVEELL